MDISITVLVDQLKMAREAWAANSWNRGLVEQCEQLTAELERLGYRVDNEGALKPVKGTSHGQR